MVQTHLQVLFDSQARKDVVVLGHKTHAFCHQPVGCETRNVVAVEQDVATPNLDLPEDCFEKSRLTSAVWPDNSDQFALSGSERALVENVHTREVASRQVLHLDNEWRFDVTHLFPSFFGARFARVTGAGSETSVSASASAAISAAVTVFAVLFPEGALCRPVTTPKSVSI